jgi:hypothetical protein
MSDDELHGSEAEFSRRAESLGKAGQISKTHKAVRDEIARRGALSAEDHANESSTRAFTRGDGDLASVQAHKDAAAAHRKAARNAGSQGAADYHSQMAKLHSKVASGKMESRDAEDSQPAWA